MSDSISRQEFDDLVARVTALEQPPEKAELVIQDDKATLKRGTRLPLDWVPSPAVRDELRLTYPNLNLNEILIEFMDYWISVPGSRGLKLSWDRTFRNRVREVAHQPRFQRRVSHSVGDKVAGWLDVGTDAESQ